MKLKGKKVGILFESDFYEHEIFYYKYRFAEEGAELHFLTRLWGQKQITFYGHEYKIPMSCQESFEHIGNEELQEYSAIIVPAGMVADRLRYSEDIHKLPPACEFLKRAFMNRNIIKGIICHGMWLLSPVADLIKGRKAVVHNNLISDLKHMGGIYIDNEVVIDGDLVTARTGDRCNLFARTIIDLLSQ